MQLRALSYNQGLETEAEHFLSLLADTTDTYDTTTTV